ncbi:putative mitochondrial import inner membrane translocase subunit [Choanephora cucurbitarum]|uniref:Mitochondrial import inner membrane translocase subunit TIM22 n=1 Tax=Choanephora cucurbitarum TaxID=101091 RepID=A0A1C7N840_9FUNG|nr:putative mitochondrial import inner membrane translocase subunit [Choanephora cucurbitarum]KAI8384125.1 mitochondrial import inner membrane translocase subunit Tim17 family protein [Blakeslea trispora]OBZ84789.1 Mitochondrial import inner membrane translocase subunit TIM22 [Choanephora cucurbitarum]
MNGPFGGMRGQNNGMSLQEQQTIQLLQGAFESCVVKTAMSGVAGFGMGAAFGLFMSSFEYSGPMTNEELVKQTTRQQLRHVAKDMGTRSYSMAKNFGLVGMIYSGTECCIESYRAKNDLANSVAAGAFTGGLLAAKAGPQAMALGAGGFAMFSLAIDWYMRRD